MYYVMVFCLEGILMLNKIKTRTPILALILFVFALCSGYTFAETKVVVIPLGADAAPAKGLEFNCPATGFFPNDSDTGYTGISRRWAKSDGAFYFLCSVHLPIGATITKLAGTFIDNGSWAGECEIFRANYATSRALAMAITSRTAGASLTPQTVSASVVEYPTVLAGYGYSIGCFGHTHLDEGVSILGAIITYDE